VKEDPLAALADIEILAPPESSTSLPMALIVLLIGIIVIAWLVARLIARRSRSTHIDVALPASTAALQRLAALRADWERGEVNDRETAYRLCALLRIGLKLPELDPRTPPPALSHIEAWAPTLHSLQKLRYARDENTPLCAQDFELARVWLMDSAPPNIARSAEGV
jgi:hypothetical protein